MLGDCDMIVESRMGERCMLRLTKIILIGLVALWGLLGGIGNLFGYASGHGQVVSIMAREGAFAAGGPFVALSHPILTHFGYAVIWSGKLLTGVLCLWGAVMLWRARHSGNSDFQAAKSAALAGCGLGLIFLFGGFVVSEGTYFGLWSSEVGALSHDFATQFIVCIGLIALFVANSND